MKNKGSVGGILALSSVFLLSSANAHADIDLIKRNEGDSLFKNFELSVGGSAEIGYQNDMGGSDDGAVEHRGYADDSNYFANASYYLNDDWKIVGYYELGASLFKAVGWNRHTYRNQGGEDTDTYQRQLYAGISSQKYGTLTYGKQYSAYYQAVGIKTDIWVMDMQGQGDSDGVDDGSYDGSYRGKNLLNYTNSFGPVTVYASYIMPAPDYYLTDDDGNAFGKYRRENGGALAASYQINDQLSWGVAYSYQKARITQTAGGQSSRKFNQQLLGTSVQWTPGNWTLAALMGVYKNFIVGSADSADDYFEGSAHGWEYYAGYAFPLHNDILQSIQPYFAGDAIHGSTSEVSHQFLGVSMAFSHNVTLAVEHQFTHNNGTNDPDVTHVRLEYDF